MILLGDACLRGETILQISSPHFHCADRETLNLAQVPSPFLALNCQATDAAIKPAFPVEGGVGKVTSLNDLVTVTRPSSRPLQDGSGGGGQRGLLSLLGLAENV